MFIRTFLVLLTSGLLFGCAITRAPSLNMLEKRADYDGTHQLDSELKERNGSLFAPVRTEPKITDIYIHPHELPTGDYFMGGWIRTVISQSRWELDGSVKPLLKPKPKKKRKNSRSNKGK